MSSFGEILKELRKEKNLTQEDFGKQFNVIKQTVSSWENGNSRPDIDLAAQIADYFNVTTDYLLGRSPHRKPTTSNDVHCPANDSASKLPADAKKSIEEFTRYIYEKHGLKPE
ncbi:MAG: transcriptional regulator, family [Firmicutes bacterium]|nr:transcriptional regulator, family [Bacillota bacterium]